MRANAQLLQRATEAVLGPVLKDYRRGLVDEDVVITMTKRRSVAIKDLYLEMLCTPRAAPACDDCAAPSSALKDGRPYCATHAKNHTRERAP